MCYQIPLGPPQGPPGVTGEVPEESGSTFRSIWRQDLANLDCLPEGVNAYLQHIRNLGRGAILRVSMRDGVLKHHSHALRCHSPCLRCHNHVLRHYNHVLKHHNHVLRRHNHVLRRRNRALRGKHHVVRHNRVLRRLNHAVKHHNHVVRHQGHVVRHHNRGGGVGGWGGVGEIPPLPTPHCYRPKSGF